MLGRFLVLMTMLVVVAKAFTLQSVRQVASSSRQQMRMVWGAKESNEHFLIAPSILSADFAKLGQEVN